MVTIEFDNNNKQLLIKCQGSDFQEQIESCRYIRARFNSSLKRWTLPVSRLEEAFKEFESYGITISEYDISKIKEYNSSLRELKVISSRKDYRYFKPNLLNYPPFKEFQKADIQKMINRNRGTIIWATGLGKSFAMFSILQHYRNFNIVDKAIILTSGIGTWNLASEAKKFIPEYNPQETLVIRSISELKDRCVFDLPDYKIIIMGYDTWKLINTAYQKKFKIKKNAVPLKKWFGNYEGIVFFDEFHLLGNPKSQRSKAILDCLDDFDLRYCFSATPADKNEKCYCWLKIMDNELIKGDSYNDWILQYWTLGNRFSEYAINYDSFNSEKWAVLQDKLYRDYSVKRGKELLNLPTAHYLDPIKVDMSPLHRKIYEAFTYHNVNTAQSLNAQNNAGLHQNIAGLFMYLQLAVDNPLCLIDSSGYDKFNDKLKKLLHQFRFEKDFVKLQVLDDILQDECIEKEHKVIVFYYHPKTLECLQNYYKGKYEYDTISAKTPKEDIIPLTKRFAKNKKAKILFASIEIANTSFTLVECKAAIYFERVFSYLKMEQSRGRIYRIGQEEEVFYYNLLYNNSIDYLQLQILDTKGKVLENLAKKHQLSSDEWKSLFSANEENLNFLK